ncbi:hypothetical protein [Bifidobacterium castoris]|uniref:Uncharacterized protein n=1 Tax=Bifidobacterium castoris TaxID=2306972 RepID=A0A430FA93_9BIFI|nr:hypothetical protein [Bifidobacterium castoris]RSX49743.1 hypothetical protein D2E22_0204 [Bifidobacterium castoris]
MKSLVRLLVEMLLWAVFWFFLGTVVLVTFLTHIGIPAFLIGSIAAVFGVMLRVTIECARMWWDGRHDIVWLEPRHAAAKARHERIVSGSFPAAEPVVESWRDGRSVCE